MTAERGKAAPANDALVVAVELVGDLGAPGDRLGRVVATRPRVDGVVQVGDDARVDGLGEAVGQARIVEAIVDRQSGGEEQGTEDEQTHHAEEQLLAVLPPHEPDHAPKSS